MLEYTLNSITQTNINNSTSNSTSNSNSNSNNNNKNDNKQQYTLLTHDWGAVIGYIYENRYPNKGKKKE